MATLGRNSLCGSLVKDRGVNEDFRETRGASMLRNIARLLNSLSSLKTAFTQPTAASPVLNQTLYRKIQCRMTVSNLKKNTIEGETLVIKRQATQQMK